ncbi:MAG: ribbon-helix-helix domain-containing protein [Alphaproteobacteria bacterium]|jgi:predicted DNA-binding ribbon-helix-helix protein|nr:ribbon-helix-helix domain-containing protein [Alphaproteobacteria bacterium]MDP6781478.1 ribbon-helix-helix domain-containing protein [Alphaproteobacteria bacterium]MDP7044198.1 ribbon-helix-helix domain-containing protein [Alphaproteobacteria bacterium]HAQ33678.1 aryl-sulfate sulfotransferase [Rhodospirillaceae bacterium]|tara:strand:+ start:40 stop:303 length:264 start_codon:yes stop_codon:yes gene_type:complete
MTTPLIIAQPENSDSARMVKHSVVIAGHRTSVSLENAFWKVLGEIAARRGLSRNRLIGIIDRDRDGNLSSAIRLFVLDELRRREPPG